MGKSDVEMEDAENLPRDPGDNVQDSEEKSLDSNGESYQENFPSEAEPFVAGDATKSENGDEDLNEFTDAAKHETTLNSDVEDQINPKDEVIQSMNSVESVGEQINVISENIEQINTGSNAEDQIDAENELVEHNPTNGGLKEEKFTDNDVEGGYHVKNVIEEKLSIGDCVENVAREENNIGNAYSGKYPAKNTQVQTDNSQGEYEEMEDEVNVNEGEAVTDELKEHGNEAFPASPVTNENANIIGTPVKHEINDCSLPNQREPVTSNSLVTFPNFRDGDHNGQRGKSVFTLSTFPPITESDDGTLKEQASFMKELGSFYRERAMDFKPPKFYGQPLNCLKLWRATIKLGGYDRVTGSKLWRQVGELFHPPKTCTTVSWTFRIFYEKSLLEFERHKTQSGELQLPVAAVLEASVVQNEGNGYQGSAPVSSGRARRDSAAHAMHGWYVHRLNSNGEVAEPMIKDKNLNNMAKRKKIFKSIGSIKQKGPNELETSVKAARIETYTQLVTSVVDVGPPADWVKINVRQLNDCFEVYALVPGLLREEVRVQSDPAGRLVITGLPEQVENHWGITPFKKVVSLPARINPLQTSAVVSLHGRLFVRVPFEQPNI